MADGIKNTTKNAQQDPEAISGYSENRLTGFILLYRSICKHWIWNDATRLKWWLTILMEVNHTDRKVLIKGTLFECQRGQSLSSIETWSKEFRCSIQQVRTFFKTLESDGMITIEGMQKTTRLTVCNYDTYNKTQRADNEQTTSRQQTDNKQITTNNNDNNYNNGNNVFLDESFEKRKNNFKNSLNRFVEKYGKDTLFDFFLYWTEPDQQNKHMKFELEKTWSAEFRLRGWVKNKKEFKEKKLPVTGSKRFPIPEHLSENGHSLKYDRP